jgi:hypothetical protein
MGQNPTDSRTTQRSRILALLIGARGAWVPLREILALGIAQYNARLFELRRMGFVLQNRVERRDGQRYSFFRLVASTTQVATSPPPKGEPSGLPPESTASEPAADSLFGDMARYPD